MIAWVHNILPRIQIKANLPTTGRQLLVLTTYLNQKCCVPIGFPNVADKIIDELIEQANNLAITSQIATIGTEAPEIGRDVRLFCHPNDCIENVLLLH